MNTMRERGERKMRRIKALAHIVGFFFLFTGGYMGGSQVYAKQINVLLVTDVHRLGDRSYNDFTWDGLLRASKELKVKINVLEPVTEADYEKILRKAAKDADVVVLTGTHMQDSLIKVAPRYPKTKFVLIEGEVSQPNVTCYKFKVEEGAFLAGILLARMSDTGKVGFIGGLPGEQTRAFEFGYRAGIITYQEKAGEKLEVVSSYTGSLEDRDKGKTAALEQIKEGIDMIFGAGGGESNDGLIEAMMEQPAEKDYYAIVLNPHKEWEAMQPIGEHWAIGRVVSSVVRKYDVAAFEGIKSSIEAKFAPGTYELGIRENGVDLSEMQYTIEYVPSDVLGFLSRIREEVIAGNIQVPKNEEEYKEFEPPTLK